MREEEDAEQGVGGVVELKATFETLVSVILQDERTQTRVSQPSSVLANFRVTVAAFPTKVSTSRASASSFLTEANEVKSRKDAETPAVLGSAMRMERQSYCGVRSNF
jgi:hypothetical protein